MVGKIKSSTEHFGEDVSDGYLLFFRAVSLSLVMMGGLSCRGWQRLTWCQLSLGCCSNTSFGWGGNERGFHKTHHSIRHLEQENDIKCGGKCCR